MRILIEEYAEAVLAVVTAIPIIMVFINVLHMVSAF